MPKPVEFASFYQLLQSVKQGNEKETQELQWMLAEYEHAKESKSAYDELGQIFCHHGIMELYDYTGLDNIQIISGLNKSVWDYLKLRIGYSLSDFMVKSMLSHAEEHDLSKKLGEKWQLSSEEIEENLDGLAKYVVEGIIEIIYP
tara:strand:- start:53 stop:487 length:435 start_codon:yes stop_codon:yes gene_type:complete